LEREKGIFDLLDAFEQIREHANLRLILVGGGKALAECTERARHSQDRIRVLGARPLDEVSRWLAACDVSCLPSWNEGMPNAVVEALASGRRVVATRVGAIPDLITDSRLGHVVEKQSPSELAGALLASLRVPYDPLEVARIANIRSWRDSAAELFDNLRLATGRTPLTSERPIERAA
jgi:glycosyltransferase involved in cell wall biosynthesis